MEVQSYTIWMRWNEKESLKAMTTLVEVWLILSSIASSEKKKQKKAIKNWSLCSVFIWVKQELSRAAVVAMRARVVELRSTKKKAATVEEERQIFHLIHSFGRLFHSSRALVWWIACGSVRTYTRRKRSRWKATKKTLEWKKCVFVVAKIKVEI